MTVFERYRIQKNTSNSAIARSYGNNAIDNLIYSHQEQWLDLEEITKEIEQALLKALEI